MKPKNTPLAALACAALLGSAALSQADVLWQLDFNSYADGNIENQAVGAGFPGNWYNGSANVTTGVVTSGNSKADLGSSFSSAVGSTGTLWLSFDWGHNSDNTNNYVDTYGGLTFFVSNWTPESGSTFSEKGLIGNTWNNSNWNTTTVSNIGMKTGVAKITLSDVGFDTVDLWVGATGSPVDVSGTPMATLSMELSGVNCLRINGGNAQTFDNLVIGTTMADVDATTPPITATWTNPAGGQWGTAGNWLDNIVATGSGSTANFNTLNISADTTVNLDSAQMIGNLVFGDTDTSPSSAAGWTLTNNGTPGNTLTLAGTTPTITVNALGATKTVTISAVVAGTTGLTKSGTGTLTLSAANTYSGATTVSDGTLQVSGQPYFNVGRTTTVASGAVFELNDSDNTFTTLMPTSTITGAGTFRLSGNSTINQSENGVNGTRLTFAMQAGGLIDLLDTSRLTNGGWQLMNWTDNKASMNIASGATFDIWDGQDVIIDALTGSGTVDKLHPGNSPRLLRVGVANGSGTFSGTIKNTGGQIALVKTGSGTQTLSGTNSYSGNTTVEAGTLEFTATSQLQFVVNSVPEANMVTGTGTAACNGLFNIDTAGVSGATGHIWLLVDRANLTGESFGSTFSIAGFQDPEDDGIWIMSDAKGAWSFSEDTGELTLDVGSDYDNWKTANGVTGGENDDDDADGLTNHEEYAFGLVPTGGSSVNPITTQLNKTTGQFTYQRRDNDLTDLTYTIWYSTTLEANSWQEDSGALQPEGTPDGNGVETISVTLSPALLSNLKLFIQVRAN
jgi:autotransporter-associated beta strand protein